ncbi:hypothetical protein QYF36_019896 [Acer negundo]|nr:hypothetical protein QYF36_019896 [Acer negundo]
MKGIYQRFRVISFIPFRQVQRAIDLYMGLGQGKLRAMELNLCLEHLKREWKLVGLPNSGRKGKALYYHTLDFVLASTLLNPHLDQLQPKLQILLLKQTGMLNEVAVLAMLLSGQQGGVRVLGVEKEGVTASSLFGQKLAPHAVLVQWGRDKRVPDQGSFSRSVRASPPRVPSLHSHSSIHFLLHSSSQRERGEEKGRKTGEARHEHTQFAEVKRARDAVFDFGSADLSSGLILVGQIVVPLGSLQDSPGLAPAPGGATHKLLTAEAFGDRDQTGRFRDVIEAYRRPPYFSQSIPDGAGETCWSGCSMIVGV